jgi:hypothetical protein
MIAAKEEAALIAEKIKSDEQIKVQKQEEKIDAERVKNLNESGKVSPEPLDLNFDEFEEKEVKKEREFNIDEKDDEKDELDTDDELEKMYLDLINKINTEADSGIVANKEEEQKTEVADDENLEDEEDEEDDEEEEITEEEVKPEAKKEVKVEVESAENDEKVKELELRLKELNSLLAIERENSLVATKQADELKQKLSEVVQPELSNGESLQTLNERLTVLQERLSLAEKNFKVNKKEFIPLQKIKKTLESDKDKLRRKEAIVAKQKVLLFGVNNYVADPEKQKKLEQDLDVLDALRLSVKHCEDVMKQNEDRYPILEKTHTILKDTVADIKADIKTVEDKIKATSKK